MRDTAAVLSVPIDLIDQREAVARISAWAEARESRMVCFCNAHSLVTALQEPGFQAVLAGSDLNCPDGQVVAWTMQRLGHAAQQRVCGPDLMLAYMGHAARLGQPVFLLGSTPQTLAALQASLAARWPTLRIVGSLSPPFRPLTPEEDAELVDTIHRAGAATVWVSLGCPKQEAWMAAHRGRVQAVMLGVGAAFDFHAGVLRRAPPWMQRAGLEWLHRLAMEPRRLAGRYIGTNSRFLWAAARQLAGRRQAR